MPKKKKGKPEKKAELEAEPGGEGAAEVPEQMESAREAQLRREYDMLTDTLNNLKRKVEKLRCENELLQDEANQIGTESQEYSAYIWKRTQKRQSTMASLSQQNEQELQALRAQRQAEEDRHAKLANELKRQILERESELVLLNNEIEELAEYKKLQKQQLERIEQLQEEVLVTHGEHSQAIQTLRTSCLNQKQKYEAKARQKVHSVAQAANREAWQCLIAHTQEVFRENQRLREELQQLIQRANVLHDHQDMLHEQREQLLMEMEYAKDQRKMRAAQCHQGAAESSAESSAGPSQQGAAGLTPFHRCPGHAPLCRTPHRLLPPRCGSPARSLLAKYGTSHRLHLPPGL
ncbi:coiled-coil domain-containing protein 166 [Megalops cyprinoides]|uniref:coiled-coil domain-containing protein 166 n=1 Tax=Megalops cyprinoides TaxID=118141 RepID=UPI001863DDA6|nr:coiled-coil domain-containing protein 166 [Megalops cyprinoides]